MSEEKVSWGAVFKNGLGLYTIMLNLGIGLHAVDVFIVTTVMPSVVRDIGGASYYSWTTMLYMVASIIGAATGSPMKAKFGARRAYCLGSLLFLIGSVSCALSPTMIFLLTARLVQGFGGGLIISLSMALVSELYPERLRKRILGLVSSTWGVAALIGPAVGGTFAQYGFWRGAFWINAPIIVGFLLAAWFRLPERRSPPPLSGFPWRRMALLTLGVLCVGVASNWHSLAVQSALVVASVLLVWQTLRLDAAGAAKLFPSHPFSPKTTTGSANWVFFLSSMTHTVIGVFLPLALQVLHGVDPLVAGYMTASLAVCWTLASMATAHLHGRAASAAIISRPGDVLCRPRLTRPLHRARADLGRPPVEWAGRARPRLFQPACDRGDHAACAAGRGDADRVLDSDHPLARHRLRRRGRRLDRERRRPHRRAASGRCVACGAGGARDRRAGTDRCADPGVAIHVAVGR